MRYTIQLLTSLLLFCSMPCVCFAQSTILGNVTSLELGLPVNDVVYDPLLDVLYASVPSIAGSPLGNSIATIDPATGAVISSTFVGSEPNTLGISNDGSHIFVGINGSQGVRSYQPATGTLSPIVSLSNAVIEDIAVLPNQPSAAVISLDSTTSTTSGSLALFDGATVTNLANSLTGNAIDFASPTSLVALSNSVSSFRANIFDLNGTTLTQTNTQTGVVGGFSSEGEVASDGLIYLTNGAVVDPATLNQLGVFNTGFSDNDVLVEAVPALDLVYFVGSPNSNGSPVVLSAFDSNNFLQVDSIALATTTALESRGELIFAGQDRLAFVSNGLNGGTRSGGPGTLNIISGVPTTAVPEPSAFALLAIVGGVCVRRRNRLSA